MKSLAWWVVGEVEISTHRYPHAICRFFLFSFFSFNIFEEWLQDTIICRVRVNKCRAVGYLEFMVK